MNGFSEGDLLSAAPPSQEATSASQREGDTAPSSPQSGWNSSHPYPTGFQQKHTACTSLATFNTDTPLDSKL
jgi:hypothetical protein